MKKIFLIFILIVTSINFGKNSEQRSDKITSPPIEYFYPVPTKEQLQWQNSELIMFIHFGINTFTGQEWGDGNESPKIFNPTKLDVTQWISLAKEIGFKYIIITAKHHDGFCLWQTDFTEHSIRNSPYKNGKGDIVKELSEACKENGLRFAFYLSPWDRHQETYGTEKYNIFFQNQLTELLTKYGDVGEVWLDGACGEGKNGKKQKYDWELYYSTIKHYQPKALIAIEGPDIKWIGNENGLGKETEWTINDRKYEIQKASTDNKVWYPSECDVSIRPRWFYHKEQDNKVKSVDNLVDIYFKSVGRNSNLLLNIPPNKDGLISEVDINRLRAWKKKLSEIFRNNIFTNAKITCKNYRYNSELYSPKNCLDNNKNTFWVTDKNINKGELTIELNRKEKINIIRLEEAIEYGQRISAFRVLCKTDAGYKKVFEGTTVGHSRIIRFDTIETNEVKILINQAEAPPTLQSIKGFYHNFN